jgi:hypothetical protein
MSSKGDRKPSMLYLLALLQLVGGPLILLQVTLFCKLTVRDAPQIGIAAAVSHVWNSDEFQEAFDRNVAVYNQEQSPHPLKDQKTKADKSKFPFVIGKTQPPLITVSCIRWKAIACERIWTPTWPQAPPGPPPRVG